MVDNLLEVMTIQETSEYLRVPVSSLYKLAQSGKIPCRKVGRHWRFRRETIERWLGENPYSYNNNDLKIKSIDQ